MSVPLVLLAVLVIAVLTALVLIPIVRVYRGTRLVACPETKRPAGLSAAMWASMVCMGEEGYLQAARAIMDTADQIRRGIAGIPELQELHALYDPATFHVETGDNTLGQHKDL